MSVGVVCVLPAYGAVDLTRSAVTAALLELPPHQVIVIDNGGDYAPVGDETVVRPGHNLGWLLACNDGLTRGFLLERVHAVALLNNDVTLSPGFFAGLAAAAQAPDAGLVAPCYDDNFKAQHRYWDGPAASFPAREVDVDAQLVDGTCLVVTREAYERVGLLDAERFGRFGWGADADYCARTLGAGLRVLVTQRSYLNHLRGVTARVIDPDYEQRAWQEMQTGLSGRYGPNWRRDLGYAEDGSGPGGLIGNLYFARRRLRRQVRRIRSAVSS